MFNTNNLKKHQLSARGEKLLTSPPLPEYLQEHFARSAKPASTQEYIPMCIAENRLVWDLLQPKMADCRDVPHQALCYDAMIGSQRFREQLTRFMGRTFLGRQFEPEQVAVLAGAGSVLEILFHVLADPGEGVLVPTPSYAGFWEDLETRDELTIVPVHCSSSDGFRLTTEGLDRALEESCRPIRALLVTSPNNPLGTVYSPEEIDQILLWAENARIHVIFDEIYALSVFGQRDFSSCSSVRTSIGERVHIVWAFSKDFGASGLRCGLLVSENEAVVAAVDALAYWACCSGDTQFLLGEMIADDAWVDGYVREMKTRLASSYDLVTAHLGTGDIPFLRAEAGFFLVLDLRTYLAEQTWDAEYRLWRRLLEEVNVNLTPGSACHCGEPGFFRLCFASVDPERAVEGVDRITGVLRKL
ncbi:MAG: aminotransferase class I/II-fold pyridoxal phosphate-dependent enzyme [bacterium]|nr:aminotransferase class I/II-fold pyridoxal phosphate-dependent enzyme [bacterium]